MIPPHLFYQIYLSFLEQNDKVLTQRWRIFPQDIRMGEMCMTDAGTTQDNFILPAPPVEGLPISQDWLDRIKLVHDRTVPIILPSGKDIGKLNKTKKKLIVLTVCGMCLRVGKPGKYTSSLTPSIKPFRILLPSRQNLLLGIRVSLKDKRYKNTQIAKSLLHTEFIVKYQHLGCARKSVYFTSGFDFTQIVHI